MGCNSSKDFYNYKNGENITDSEYTDIGKNISVMAVNQEGKAAGQVCLKCQKFRQLWNIKYKMTNDIKLVLKNCCYSCYCSHIWVHNTEDILCIGNKLGKVIGKLTCKEHSTDCFQCEGCRKYLHIIYDVEFDKPINSYPKACKPGTETINLHNDRVVTKWLNSYCYRCIEIIMHVHIKHSQGLGIEW